MVRIDRAMDPMMWYASKVGQTVELCRHPDHSKSVYWARDGGGYINSIRKKDAVLLPPDPKDGLPGATHNEAPPAPEVSSSATALLDAKADKLRLDYLEDICEDARDKLFRTACQHASVRAAIDHAMKVDGEASPQRRVLHPAVLALAEDMQFKLTKNEKKPCNIMLREGSTERTWGHCSLEWLRFRILDEWTELRQGMEAGDMRNAQLECADIANFAMMIHDNLGKTLSTNSE